MSTTEVSEITEPTPLSNFTIAQSDAGKRLDAFLSEQIEGWSRSRLQRLITDGDVLVNGKTAKASYKLHQGDEIDVDSLPPKIRNAAGSVPLIPDENTLESIERRHITDTLESVDGDKVAAGRRLGIDLSTLYRKLKRYEEG